VEQAEIGKMKTKIHAKTTWKGIIIFQRSTQSLLHFETATESHVEEQVKATS
jgi:hypothetical protein